VREAEPHARIRIRRRLDEVHALDLLQFALRLRRLARLCTEAVHKILQPLDLALLVRVGRRVLHVARGLLGEVGVEIPAVAVQLAACDLHDVAHELVQKVAVVRNHHDRAGIAAQVFAEPHERFEVEMVRRLVEQQQIGLLREQPREVRAHDPAAAQRRRRAVHILLAERQPRENPLRLRRDRVPVILRKIADRLVVFVALRIARGLAAAHRLTRLDELRRHARREIDHRLAAHRRALLRQKAERDPALHRDAPLVRRILAEDDREQRGLPRTIRADEPDAIATVHLQRGTFEKHAAREGF